jgi:DnaJ-class molecular chaperone
VKGKKGDLLVNIQIVTPDLLPDSVKKLAEEWKKVTEGDDPRGFFYSKAQI